MGDRPGEIVQFALDAILSGLQPLQVFEDQVFHGVVVHWNPLCGGNISGQGAWDRSGLAVANCGLLRSMQPMR